jgi:hypothetical protein
MALREVPADYKTSETLDGQNLHVSRWFCRLLLSICGRAGASGFAPPPNELNDTLGDNFFRLRIAIQPQRPAHVIQGEGHNTYVVRVENGFFF